MASYLELDGLLGNGDLLKKCRMACLISASEILTGTNTGAYETGNEADRLQWALAFLRNPDKITRYTWWLALALNKSATVEQIEGATETTITNNVRSVVDAMADALVAQGA